MPRLLRTLTYASVPALVVAFALTAATGALLHVPIAPGFFVAVLAGAWLVYLAERLVGAPEDALNHPARTHWVAVHRTPIIALCVACGCAGGAAALTLRPHTLIGGLALGFAGATYALPLVGGRRLKTFFIVKPLLVGAVWAVATVLLPLVEAGHAVGTTAVVLFAVRGLTVGANVLLHDWTERAGDRAASAATLPLTWTWARLRSVVGLLLLLALLCEGVLATIVGPFVLVDAAGVLLLALMLRREPNGGWRESLLLDLLVAWPLVTALTYS